MTANSIEENITTSSGNVDTCPVNKKLIVEKFNLRPESKSELFSGLFKYGSFFEFPWDDAGKKGSEQDGENDDAEFLKYVHFITILCCIWLFISVFISTHNSVNKCKIFP